MLQHIRSLYAFGDFRLDVGERLLLRNDKPISLTSKVFDILTTLVQNSGHLLEKDDLMQAVWPDTAVEEGNLTRYISTLRKALGEQSNGCQYIETVPKRGYRFVADVKVVETAEEELISRERTIAQVTAQVVIEDEEETDGQNESGEETGALAKAPASRRWRRRQVLIATVTALVMTMAAAYWWKTIKTRQSETNPQIRSIAVLPFTQLGEGAKDELLGFGMADVLITRIGSVNRIAVRPTSAVFKYIGAEPDIESVVRELKVDALVEGTIQRMDERIRVTVRIVQARDGGLLWAQTFDGRHTDLFAMQDDMSERVVAALSLNTEQQKGLLTKRYTKSGEANHAYMKGRYFWNKREPDDLKKAIEYFEQAIQKDANYALAFAGLADCYSMLVAYTQVAAKEGFPKAKDAATKAIRIDNTLGEAHAALAKIYHLYDWDWEGAEREFTRAIELKPDYPTAHQWYGEYLISMGRLDKAKAEMRLALDLDPVSPAINVAQGFPYYYGREYDEAIQAYVPALELAPGLVHFRLHQVYIKKGMYNEAGAEDVATYDRFPEVREKLRALYATEGIRGRWKIEVDAAERLLDKSRRIYVAWAYAYLGDKENALEWLERGYRERYQMLVDLKVDPVFDDLRSDPRFTDLLRRMRLSE